MNNQIRKTDLISSSQVGYRLALGILGMAFPIILLIGGALDGQEIQTSISAYYHLNTSPGPYIPTMRDIFVGVLFVIGVALYFYQGYEKKAGEPYSDNSVANVAGIAAIVVALSPTDSGADVLAPIHSLAAGVFFLAITYFCWKVFTRGSQNNDIYKRCAIIMAGALVAIVVVAKLFPHLVEDWKAVFWLESLAVATFGYAWWVKAATPVASVLKHGPKKAAAMSLSALATEPAEEPAAEPEEESASEEEAAAIPLPNLSEEPLEELPAEAAEEEAGEEEKAGKPPDDRSPK